MENNHYCWIIVLKIWQKQKYIYIVDTEKETESTMGELSQYWTCPSLLKNRQTGCFCDINLANIVASSPVHDQRTPGIKLSSSHICIWLQAEKILILMKFQSCMSKQNHSISSTPKYCPRDMEYSVLTWYVQHKSVLHTALIRATDNKSDFQIVFVMWEKYLVQDDAPWV